MSRRLLIGCLIAVALMGCSRPPPAVVLPPSTSAPLPVIAVADARPATLRGRVQYQGEPPKLLDLAKQINDQGDRDICLKAKDGTIDRTWLIEDGGVANVAIWLRPPDGVWPSNPVAAPADDVRVAIAHCQYEPRVSVTFPQYFDRQMNGMQLTGQQTRLVNQCPAAHDPKRWPMRAG